MSVFEAIAHYTLIWSEEDFEEETAREEVIEAITSREEHIPTRINNSGEKWTPESVVDLEDGEVAVCAYVIEEFEDSTNHGLAEESVQRSVVSGEMTPTVEVLR